MKIIHGPGSAEVHVDNTRLNRRWVDEHPDIVTATTEGDPLSILLNVRSVEIIDGAGMHIITKLSEHCTKRGGCLYIAEPSTMLQHFIKTSGVKHSVRIVEDAETSPEWLAEKMRVGTMLGQASRVDDREHQGEAPGY